MRHRKDNNRDGIVKALRQCGFQVEFIERPLDLLVTNGARTFLMEVKNGSGYTKAQEEFIARWPGEWHTVETIDEALAAAVGKEAMR